MPKQENVKTRKMVKPEYTKTRIYQNQKMLKLEYVTIYKRKN